MTDTTTPPPTVVEQLEQRIAHWEEVERHWGHRPDGCLCPVARNLNLDRLALAEIRRRPDPADVRTVATGRAHQRENFPVGHPGKFVGTIPSLEWDAALDRMLETLTSVCADTVIPAPGVSDDPRGLAPSNPASNKPREPSATVADQLTQAHQRAERFIRRADDAELPAEASDLLVELSFLADVASHLLEATDG